MIYSMVSSQEIYKTICSALQNIYPKEESQSIAFLILESLYKLDKVKVLADKEISNFDARYFESVIERLKTYEPIQYIIGETEFYDCKFLVNSSVLIPRPETEELVHLIISENSNNRQLNILDIGTGTGCIPIVLSDNFPQAAVFAIDVDVKVLETARKNAALNNVSVDFRQLNILKENLGELPDLDIIVSNPPYVTKKEFKLMEKNVLDFEPHLALFVEDNEPLIFYEKITSLALNKLNKNGLLYFEINEMFGKEVSLLLQKYGFKEIRLIQDLNGKDRIVRGMK